MFIHGHILLIERKLELYIYLLIFMLKKKSSLRFYVDFQAFRWWVFSAQRDWVPQVLRKESLLCRVSLRYLAISGFSSFFFVFFCCTGFSSFWLVSLYAGTIQIMIKILVCSLVYLRLQIIWRPNFFWHPCCILTKHYLEGPIYIYSLT